MFTVALIGPDGAGKTTIARRLEQTLSMPATYLYMGVNASASTHMLPTTRLIRRVKRALGAPPDNAGPPDPARVRARPRHPLKRMLRDVKAALALANRAAEEWYRQSVVWSLQRRGHVVLLDRHYFADYHAYDIQDSSLPWDRRLHGWMLRRFYPRPDLVLYLDAPAAVLFARKGEGTIEALERRREDYLRLRDVVEHFVILDATRPADVVARDAGARIEEFHAARRRSRQDVPPTSSTSDTARP
jgi:thymidylate kinase